MKTFLALPLTIQLLGQMQRLLFFQTNQSDKQ